MFLQVGQLVDATCGDLTGLDVLQELCRHIGAGFYFDTDAVAARQLLVAYPTDRLIEKIKKRTGDLEAIRAVTPNSGDVPVYRVGAMPVR